MVKKRGLEQGTDHAGCEVEEPIGFERQLLSQRDRLLRAAYLMLGSREDAEDVTQRSLLKAIRSQHAFRGDSGLYTWLYRILVNQCKDLYKARTRRSRVFIEMSEPIQAKAGRDPDAQVRLERRESDQMVRTAMSQLPDKFREILVLRHFEEMSYEQIARVLECPLGTVRSRLSKARDKLRSILKAERSQLGAR